MLRNAGAWTREVAYSCMQVLGGSAGFLRTKKQYHAGRESLEREVLRRAHAASGLLLEGRCPVCGDRVASDQFRNPVGFSFSTCSKDGTVYMDPVPSEEVLAELYNAPEESFIHETQARLRRPPASSEDLSALLRLGASQSRGGRLLDVGCATGDFLLGASQYFEAEGVELSRATAEVARERGQRVTVGTIFDLPEESVFDVVTMLQVIEHIADAASVLQQIKRRLRPGGLLYINTPAIDSTSFRMFGREHTHVSSFGHVSLFSRRSLRRLGERAGLELVAHEECGGLDFALHDVVSRWLAPKRFRHRMAFYSVRFYYLCRLAELCSFGLIEWGLGRGAVQSYQRVLFRRPLAPENSHGK